MLSIYSLAIGPLRSLGISIFYFAEAQPMVIFFLSVDKIKF